jgi:hypothetical protein
MNADTILDPLQTFIIQLSESQDFVSGPKTWEHSNYPPSSSRSTIIDLDQSLKKISPDKSWTEPLWKKVIYARVQLGSGGIPSTTSQKWKTADECKSSYLNDTSLTPDDWGCVACPPGASCEADKPFGVVALFGWARCPLLKNSKAPNFTKCLYRPACQGAPNIVLKGKYVNESDTTIDLALVDLPESCANGYTKNASENLRCSTCAPNFAPVEGGRCEECAGSGGSAALVVIAVFLAVIIFTILVALKMRSSRSKKAEHSTMKRTLLTHLQMLSIVMSLTVPWPVAVRSILTFVSSITSISAQASSIQCTTTGEGLAHATIFYITLTCSVLLPFVMMLVTFVYWFVCVPQCKVLSCGKKLRQSSICPERNPFRVQQQQQQSVAAADAPVEMQGRTPRVRHKSRFSLMLTTDKRQTRSTRDGWIVTNVLLMYILNPSIVKSCFQMLQSEPICDAEYWSLDDTVKFEDANHQSMILFVAFPSLLFYGVVCPLLAMFYIGLHADRQTNRKLMFRFGLLYSGFAPKYWFYELILFLRKLLIILVVTFASSNEQQLHIALGVLIVLLYLLEHLQPYNAEDASPKDRVMQNRLHRMESLSLVILIGMVWSAVFFVLGCNDNNGTCSVLGVGVLGSNVIFAFGSGYVVAKSFQKKNQLGEKLDRLSSALFSKLTRPRRPKNHTSGDEEVQFETTQENGEEELGCSVKINPLADGAATRDEFRTRRASSKQKRVMGSSSSTANGAAAAEIELTTVVEKVADEEEEDHEEDNEEVGEEEESLEIFVDENTGGRYSWNKLTGESKWLP